MNVILSYSHESDLVSRFGFNQSLEDNQITPRHN